MATTSPPSDLDYRPSYLAAAIVVARGVRALRRSRSPRPRRCGTRANTSPPRTRSACRIRRAIRCSSSSAASSRSCRSRSTVAVRINLLAAICSAVSAGMWFLITERVLVSWFAAALAAHRRRRARRAHRRDGVHGVEPVASSTRRSTPSRSIGIAIISWLMVRWCDEPDGRKADRILVLVAYLLRPRLREPHGRHARRAGRRTRGADRPAGARSFAGSCCSPASARWCFGLTPFATQPIRAAHFPAINEGEPTGVPHEARGRVHVLQGDVRRVHVQLQSRPVRQARARASARRRSPRRSACGGCTSSGSGCATRTTTTPFSQALLAALFLVLGLLGGWVHWQRDRRSFWYFGSLMFTMTLVLIYYLNFKYGASQAPELAGVAREVRDRDYFYPLELLGVGRVGGARARRPCGSRSRRSSVARRDDSRPRDGRAADATQRWRIASPVLALALIPLFTNWTTGVARRPDRHARLRARPAQLRRAVRRARHRRRQRHVPALVRAGSRRAFARTSSSRTRRCSTPIGTRASSSVAPSTSTMRRKGPSIYRGEQLAEADGRRSIQHDARSRRTRCRRTSRSTGR